MLCLRFAVPRTSYRSSPRFGTFAPPAAARRWHAGMSVGALTHQPSDGAGRAEAAAPTAGRAPETPGDCYPASASDVILTREDPTPRGRRRRCPRRLRGLLAAATAADRIGRETRLRCDRGHHSRFVFAPRLDENANDYSVSPFVLAVTMRCSPFYRPLGVLIMRR